jgi:hypothetical protein
MIAPRHEIPRLQSNFYRDQFRKIIKWVLVCTVVNIIFVGIVIYYVFITPPRVYYANTIAGKIMNMPPAR